MHELHTIDDVGSQTVGKCLACKQSPCGQTHQVHLDLSLGVKFKVTVSLESALDQLSELGREAGVVEVVHPQSRPRSLGRIRRTNSLLRRADRRPTKLDLLEAIDNLVEAKDEVSSVGDEEAVRALESWNPSTLNPTQIRVTPYSPFRSSVSSSLNNDGMCTTTPDPMNPTHFSFTSPLGNRLNA